MVGCVVPDCEVNHRNNPNNESFHRFPSDTVVKEKWIRVLNRPNWTPHKCSTVCSKHFEASCFRMNKSLHLLKKDSVPTKFVPVKLKQRSTTLYVSPMIDTQSSVNSLDKKFYQNTIQQLRSKLQTRQNLITARKQQAYGVQRKVEPSMQPVNKNSKDKIHACRACLTTDARFAFLENSMMQAFLELVGTPFVSTDVDMPQYFCALCRTELSKFVAFRERCQRASELLRTLNEFDALTSDDISAIDRDCYKLTHNLNKVDVYQYNSNEVHYFTPIRIKIEDEAPALDTYDKNSRLKSLEIKECKNLDILEENMYDTDNERETFDTDSNDTENEAEVEYLDDAQDEKEEILEKSSIYIEDGEQECLEEFNDTGDKTKAKINVVFDDDEHEVYETLDEEEEIEENKVEYLEMEFSDDASIDKNIYSIIEQTENIADVEKSSHPQPTKRKACKAELDYPNFDCAAFEKRYQVKITVLEKEEQLKEIDDRKKESSYLKASYKCELCGKGFKAEKAFINHMTYHDQRAGRFLCEICHFRFPRHRLLLHHRKMHRVKYTCLQCGYVCRGRAFATRHREVHLGKKYSCKHCSQSFERRTTCYSHARLCHARDNIACEQCGETFISLRGVRLHQSRAHREPKAEFKCPICQVNFESSKARDKHESTASIDKHNNMTLSPCAVCGENCDSPAALDEHSALKHSADQFRCEECDKTFSSAASFDTHTARKHRASTRKPRERASSPPAVPARRTKVVCEICGLFVTNKYVLSQHQNIHTVEKPFKCPYCSRGFAFKHARKFHIRTHTGERPHQCEQCPLAFALPGNLRRHNRVMHLGQRPSFPCELCGKTFTTLHGVKLHVNTVHNGAPWPKRDRSKRKTTK